MPDFGHRVKNKTTIILKLIPTCCSPLCCYLHHLIDTCGRLDNRGAWTRDAGRISLYADSTSIRTTLLLWTETIARRVCALFQQNTRGFKNKTCCVLTYWRQLLTFQPLLYQYSHRIHTHRNKIISKNKHKAQCYICRNNVIMWIKFKM
jgi:hypothetical protein